MHFNGCGLLDQSANILRERATARGNVWPKPNEDFKAQTEARDNRPQQDALHNPN
jgi:hypothetical protein